MKKKIICFDLDEVICTNKRDKNNLIDYNASRPKINSIKKINKLYELGYQIDIFTARGMTRYHGDINLILKKIRKLTLAQLKKWKIKFHNLYFGKPYYDLFIDDKCYGYKKSWAKDISKYLVKLK
jgi:histidinol phosphatase-like enzyme